MPVASDFPPVQMWYSFVIRKLPYPGSISFLFPSLSSFLLKPSSLSLFTLSGHQRLSLGRHKEWELIEKMKRNRRTSLAETRDQIRMGAETTERAPFTEHKNGFCAEQSLPGVQEVAWLACFQEFQTVPSSALQPSFLLSCLSPWASGCMVAQAGASAAGVCERRRTYGHQTSFTVNSGSFRWLLAVVCLILPRSQVSSGAPVPVSRV